MSSFLFYEDYDEMEEETRDIYRAGMAAFEGIAPEYHIELRDQPTMVWDVHSLLLVIQMMFSFMLVDGTASLMLCPNCYKAFFTENEDDVYCSEECGFGHIALGKTIWSDQPIVLPPEAFLLHTGIFRKTTLLKQMIRRFTNQNIPVLILEPIKREYRSMVREVGSARVFTLESPVIPLLLNPFRVPEGVKLGDYMDRG